MKSYRYIAFPAIWLGMYYGPMYAGDWWDGPLFNLWQSIPSLVLILAVLLFKREKWAKVFIFLVFCEFGLNISDAIADFEVSTYDTTMNLLNSLEVLCWVYGTGIFDWLAKKAGGLASKGKQGNRKHEPVWNTPRHSDRPDRR